MELSAATLNAVPVTERYMNLSEDIYVLQGSHLEWTFKELEEAGYVRHVSYYWYRDTFGSHIYHITEKYLQYLKSVHTWTNI